MKIQCKSNRAHHGSRVQVAAIALCLLLLAGCSATQLAYRNLDWLISRKVNQLVDLNSSQQAWFDNQLQGTLQWHCQQEIPRYHQELTRIGKRLLSADLEPQSLEADIQRAEASANRLLERTAPLMSGLLQRLDDDQIQELRSNMDEHLDEQYQELASPPLQERQEHSIKELSSLLERWLGRLNTPQKALVEQWAASRSRDDSNRIWLDNRRHWQGLLFDELATRQQNDFSQRIRHLLVDYRQLQTPAYAQQVPGSKLAFSQLLTGIMQAATAKQKKHFSTQLEELLEDLQALDCSSDKS